jgi:hypothetical protein
VVPAAIRTAAAKQPAERTLVAPAVLPADEEAPLDLEKSAADTNDSRASAKTAPQPVHRPARHPRRSRPSWWRRWRSLLTAPRPGERLWWVLIGAAVGIVLLLVALGLRAFLWPNAHPLSWGRSRHPLVVNRAGGPDVFPRLRDAVASARANDVILVQSDLTEAGVRIEKIKNLHIVAEQGKTVTWKCPENAGNRAKLLALTQMEGFELKGLTLDGGQRAEVLITVSDKCPGLTLQDVRLQNFAKYGVLISDSQGTPSKPIRFAGVRFITKEQGQTGLFYQMTKGLGLSKKHIVLAGDCTFTGPGGRVKVSDPAAFEQIDVPATVHLEMGQ